MKPIPLIGHETWLKRIRTRTVRGRAAYYAMYSSYADGIVTDPALMMVPVDDHVVHRGDGVFETLKCVAGGIYNLRGHLERLLRSAEGIRLRTPCNLDELERIIVATAKAGGRPDAQIRVLLTRGPGSLGVNPNDCAEPQLYVVIGEPVRPFMEQRPQGARIGLSRLLPKPPPFAALKTCNYLPNALMAAEGTEQGYDFMVGLAPDDYILEGPTENILAITHDKRLVSPDAPDVLPGTTLDRIITLLDPLMLEGALNRIERRRIARAELMGAREVWICGTSHDLVAVTRVEETAVGDGTPGSLYTQLAPLLADDIRSNDLLRTHFHEI